MAAADAPPPPSGDAPRSRRAWIAVVAVLAGASAAVFAYRAMNDAERSSRSETEKKRKKKTSKKTSKKKREDQDARTPDDVTPAPAPAPEPVPAPAPPRRRSAGCSEPSAPDPALVDRTRAPDATAPATFRARFDTTVGTFTLVCKRELAPHAADRLFNLLAIRFYDGVPFFRVVEGFVTQWGIHPNPDVNTAWQTANIEPDRVVASNTRGMLTFAQAGAPAKPGFTSERRSVQLYINQSDNHRLDSMGFAPFCEVVDEGMDVVDEIYAGYGEKAGRDQSKLNSKGGTYMKETYPALDYIDRACLIE